MYTIEAGEEISCSGEISSGETRKRGENGKAAKLIRIVRCRNYRSRALVALACRMPIDSLHSKAALHMLTEHESRAAKAVAVSVKREICCWCPLNET